MKNKLATTFLLVPVVALMVACSNNEERYSEAEVEATVETRLAQENSKPNPEPTLDNIVLAPSPEPTSSPIPTADPVETPTRVAKEIIPNPSLSRNAPALTQLNKILIESNPLFLTPIPEYRKENIGIIAFEATKDGVAGMIYTVHADGTNLTPLTKEGMSGIGPVWSPDGSRLAYTCVSGGNSSPTFQVCLVKSDGSGHTELTDSSKQSLHPSWSPDGTQLGFTCGETGQEFVSQLCVKDIEGTGKSVIETNETENIFLTAWAPKWAPDGSRIIFGCGISPDNSGILILHICAMNVDGTGQEILTDNGEVYHGPSTVRMAWSPDSSQILFISKDEDSVDQVNIINSDGTGHKVLTHGPGNKSWVDWAPDGSQIAFFSEESGTGQIFVQANDGSTYKRPLTTTGYNEFPDWSPDGSHIAFSCVWGKRGRGVEELVMHLCIKDVESGEDQNISNILYDYVDIEHVSMPVWSPP